MAILTTRIKNTKQLRCNNISKFHYCYTILLLTFITNKSIFVVGNPSQCFRNILLHSNPYHTCDISRCKTRIKHVPNSAISPKDENNIESDDLIIQCSTKTKPKPNKEELYNNNGFYYGIGGTILKNKDEDLEVNKIPRPLEQENVEFDSKDPMIITKFLETLIEFRENMDDIRDSLQSLRQDLNEISTYLKDLPSLGKSKTMDDEDGIGDAFLQTKKQKYESMARDIEEWANNLILEGDDGWKDIVCNKFFREKLNKREDTKCYLKWLSDSRKNEDETLYPCMKIIATLNAPYEHVCNYLSNPLHISEYNDLVIQHEDVEDISSNSKICWSSCPQILFLKPRDFVTFCCLKWKNGGDTQLVLSEAVDHESMPGYDGEDGEGSDRFCRAFALRGANCEFFTLCDI